MNPFVCAFRGRRDSYQVPLALAEASILDLFITDAYSLPWVRTLSRLLPGRLRDKADFRHEPGIPHERVMCLWGTTLHEHARHRLGYSPALTYMTLDRRFSQAAARRAEQSGADLLLYSPYAWEAFISNYSHTPRRVLFQYHPHPELEHRVLKEDSERFPRAGESFSWSRQKKPPEHLVQRERDCWKYADLILCASSFTQHSLVEAGVDPSKCQVVPYGINVPEAPSSDAVPRDASMQAVFVGSGGQRKGLHHLLLAWRQASLPLGSRLTLVCRVIDKEVERMARETDSVELLRGVSQSSLNQLYASSTLFVMPSLVEGFGQVYLEALAQGCPVLGTPHTCLQDLGSEADGVYMTPAADVEQLSARLEELSRSLPGDLEIRQAARQCAQRFDWLTFREGIRQALSSSAR